MQDPCSRRKEPLIEPSWELLPMEQPMVIPARELHKCRFYLQCSVHGHLRVWAFVNDSKLEGKKDVKSRAKIRWKRKNERTGGIDTHTKGNVIFYGCAPRHRVVI